MFLTPVHKPAEFIVQVFAHVVTVSKTSQDDDRLTCMESQVNVSLGNLAVKSLYQYKLKTQKLSTTRRFDPLEITVCTCHCNFSGA